jgi:hypothetical protein
MAAASCFYPVPNLVGVVAYQKQKIRQSETNNPHSEAGDLIVGVNVRRAQTKRGTGQQPTYLRYIQGGINQIENAIAEGRDVKSVAKARVVSLSHR